MLDHLVLALLVAHVRAAVNDTADFKELVSKKQTFGADPAAFDDNAVDPYLYGGDDEEAYTALTTANAAQYYGDEYDAYYADTNAYVAGFGDYMQGDAGASCIEGKDGKANLTVPACDVIISGVDAEVNKLDGGIDGTYKVAGCHDDKPKYLRESAGAEARIMWYSKFHTDWEITRGSTINMTQAALLMYQHGKKYSKPDLVPADNWHIRSEHLSNPPADGTSSSFSLLPATMKCVKGQMASKDPPPTPQLRPLLDDSEMTAKYREVHTRYSPLGDPSPTINFALVLFVIVAGMGVVLGIPYLFYGKTAGKARSWAQQIEDSRKVRVGHVS